MTISSEIDPFTLVAVPLQMSCGEEALASSTGFLYKKNDEFFLVSNWHVFSGRDTYCGQPLCKETGAIPDTVSFHLHKKNEINKWAISIERSLGGGGPPATWFQHPSGQDIDVAVLPIKELPNDAMIFWLPHPDETRDLAFHVGLEVFVVGFPRGLKKTRTLSNLETWFSC